MSFFCFILWVIGASHASQTADAGGGGRTELTYAAAIQQGLERNLDIAAQKFNIDAAEAAALMAGALANPSLYLDTQLMPFGRNWHQTSTGGPGQQDAYLNIPIDVTGKRSKAESAARFAKNSVESQFQDYIRAKKNEIALSYTNLSALQSMVELLTERQDSFEQIRKIVIRRLGNARILPLMQSRVELATVQAGIELQSKLVDLEQETIHLGVLLGMREAGEKPIASTGIRHFPKYENRLEILPLLETAKKTRPDLRALQQQKEQSEWELKAARARILDDFTLLLGSSYQNGVAANSLTTGPNPGAPSIPGAWSWIAGVTIPLPVFSQNSGGIKKAVALRDQSEAGIAALEVQIRADVEFALKSLDVTSTQLKSFEKSTLENARRVRDGTQKLFGTGAASFLEYFDAVNAYQSIIAAYIQSLADHRRAVIRLNQAVGSDILP